jgi:hypothetical protein
MGRQTGTPPGEEATSTTATAADALSEPIAEPAAVSATEPTRRYGEGDTAVDALRGVSLEVADGRLTAAILAGILAAVAPARRASRLDVLSALQYE